MNPNECLSELYVKLRYVPPQHPQTPIDCKRVTFSKPPEIKFASKAKHLSDPLGIKFRCALPFTKGAGGVNIVMQVSAYIEWEIEFESAEWQMCLAPLEKRPANPWQQQSTMKPQFSTIANARSQTIGRIVQETHRIYASLPMAYTIHGAQVMLNCAMPWQFRLFYYSAKILAAFRELKEIEEIMALLVKFKKGFCSPDVIAMIVALRLLEMKLNAALHSETHGSGSVFANTMRSLPNRSGRLVGNRMA